MLQRDNKLHKSLNSRHFLDISELDKTDLKTIINTAHSLKKADPDKKSTIIPPVGSITTLAMIFEKSSTRTRVSFDMAMRHLGGQTMVLNSADLQIGRGETIEDTARVMSRFIDIIMIRTGSHEKLLNLAKNATVPVINGLTDFSHPCQILADILTYEEHRGSIKGKTISWVGDGNNMTNSWIQAAAKFGFELRLACPPEFSCDGSVLKKAISEGAKIITTTDPKEAVKNADCVMTDTWVSMGDKDAEFRHKILAPYQVNKELMAMAANTAIFMHCLPAHRGEEVTSDVIDGVQSVVFDEAENRMHIQKAILAWCLGKI